MTVREFREILTKYPDDTLVKVWSLGHGGIVNVEVDDTYELKDVCVLCPRGDDED